MGGFGLEMKQIRQIVGPQLQIDCSCVADTVQRKSLRRYFAYL